MKNDILRCTCVDMSVDGLGIAKCGDLVVFVKGMIKGETADVKIIAEKKNYSVGIIHEMIEASPYRVTSRCKIAYKCGGCDYRHIDYDHQLRLKKEVLVNTLQGYEVCDIQKEEEPLYYRNKIQIPYRNGKMGFYRRNSNDIVEFPDCLIESKIGNQIIRFLKGSLKKEKDAESIRHIVIKHARETDEVMVAFVVRSFDIDLSRTVFLMTEQFPEIRSVLLNLNDRKTNVILGDEIKVLYGRDHIFDIYDGIRVKLSLKSFYQVNHSMMKKLYAKIAELAGNDPDARILDLYCGIGTISLYLARHAGHVTGVEIVKEAIDNANDNAVLNQLDNVDFVLADASKGMDPYLKDRDIVVVDPPRKGISKELISSILNSDVKKVIYVSCNPATLKRDLDLLKEGFDISPIYPFDMFPYTTHTECVTLLTRKEG